MKNREHRTVGFGTDRSLPPSCAILAFIIKVFAAAKEEIRNADFANDSKGVSHREILDTPGFELPKWLHPDVLRHCGSSTRMADFDVGWLRMRVAFVVASFVAVSIGAHSVCDGQEFNPRDPEIIRSAVKEAELIGVGTFKASLPLPWIDGWHYSGVIQFDTILFTVDPEAQVSFRWIEPYGATCLICRKLSIFKNHSGIWFLRRKNSEWILTGTLATMCGGPLPLDTRLLVTEAIRQRSSK